MQAFDGRTARSERRAIFLNAGQLIPAARFSRHFSELLWKQRVHRPGHRSASTPRRVLGCDAWSRAPLSRCWTHQAPVGGVKSCQASTRASLRVLDGNNEDRGSINGIDDRVRDLLEHAPMNVRTSGPHRPCVRHLGDQGERVAHLCDEPLAIETGAILQFEHLPRDGSGQAAASAPRGGSRLRHGIGRIDKLHAPLLDVLQPAIEYVRPRGLVPWVVGFVEAIEQQLDELGPLLGREPQRLFDDGFDRHERSVTWRTLAVPAEPDPSRPAGHGPDLGLRARCASDWGTACSTCTRAGRTRTSSRASGRASVARARVRAPSWYVPVLGRGRRGEGACGGSLHGGPRRDQPVRYRRRARRAPPAHGVPRPTDPAPERTGIRGTAQPVPHRHDEQRRPIDWPDRSRPAATLPVRRPTAGSRCPADLAGCDSGAQRVRTRC